MRKNYFKLIFSFFILLFITTVQLHAQFDFPNVKQRTLIDVDVDTTGEITIFGPNRLLFGHGVMQLGGKPGPQEYGLQTNWWSSSIDYGERVKLKLWSWEAIVVDIGYRYDRFSMRTDTPKLFPLDPTVHQRERISMHCFSGSFCNRINFGRRGNIMGSWLDLGIYGDWIFKTSNVFVDQHYDSNSSSGFHYKSKTKITRLPYVQDMNYGFTARVGGDYVGVFAQWRINNLIKSSYVIDNRDLPKLTIGLEFYLL